MRRSSTEEAHGIMNERLERVELNTVLSSTLFARAPDLSKILKYVCEKHFSNEADTIKEYSIALEALGRGADFRPGEDSIVRVQAARLRKHLKRYYETDGVSHALQIRISATGYRPEFIHAAPPAVQVAEDAGGQDSKNESADPFLPALPGGDGATPERSGVAGWRRWRRLGFTLALAALAVAVLGGMFKYGSVAGSPEPPSAPPAALPGISIRAGFSDPTFLDATGSTWLGDRYFTGGVTFSEPASQIRRTFDQSLYQTGRRGNFSYAIPLRPGLYELHLHFAEVFFGLTIGADTQRTFDVSVNGAKAMILFDIAKDAGGVDIADEKIFKDVSPGSDGFLRLDFSSVRSQALLNGIEVLPGTRGRMLPVRIVCSNRSRLDRSGWLWQADQYFSGGRIAELADAVQDPRFGAFSSYRTGNFDYAIPVPDGAYQIRLMLAEPVAGRNSGHPNDGVGWRLFDIYCNGRTLAGKLDVFKEAGGAYRVVEKVFRDVKPDAQGKILISFVPVKNYSVLFALEVTDESR
jgi:hypothetical protein